MGASHQNADSDLKRAVVLKLRADMDANLITGLTEIPLVVQNRPLQTLDEPYVWIDVEDSFETDVSRDSSSREYNIIANIIVRSDDNASAIRTKEDIANEITAIFDVTADEYIEIEDYTNGIQNVKDIINFQFVLGGATYYQAQVQIVFRLTFLGDARTAVPFQNPIYSYDAFDFSPLSNNIEMFDMGTIMGATTYSSSNGWDFDSVTYTLADGSDGTITGNDIAVSTTDTNVDITSVINYTRALETTDLTRTTEFNRIQSLRYGVVQPQTEGSQPTFLDDDSDTYGIRSLSQWDTGNRHLRFNRVSPVGQIIEFDAIVGDYVYIAIDSNRPALVSIINEAGGIQEETIQLFNSRVVDGYQIYIMRRIVEFAGALKLILN